MSLKQCIAQGHDLYLVQDLNRQYEHKIEAGGQIIASSDPVDEELVDQRIICNTCREWYEKFEIDDGFIIPPDEE